MNGKRVYELQQQDEASQATREAQAIVGGPVYKIPVENLGHLAHEIETKVNKRAKKLGLKSVEIKNLEEEVVEWERYDPDHPGQKIQMKRVWQYVAIIGETPMIKGWRFIATIEHTDHGNLMRSIPQLGTDEAPEVDLTPYREADPGNCDHCKKFRRRNDTYLLLSDEGSLKQVGSTCLGDFLGAADPQLYAKYAQYLRDFLYGLEIGEDGEGYGPRRERVYDLDNFLANANLMIRKHGWVSRSAASLGGDRATADRAWDNLTNRGVKDKWGKDLSVPPEAQDDEQAELVIEWVRSLDTEGADLNDYLLNLVVCFRHDYVTERRIGYVASAIVGYSKHVEREIKRQQREAAGPKDWVGVVGQRGDIGKLTLVRTVWVEDYYNGGSKPLYIFNDADGNEVKWFSSNDKNLREGEAYSVSATVKSHDDHEKFGKSTVITRAKVEVA